MKRLTVFLIILILTLTANATALEYQGEFDPIDILKWRVVERHQIAEDKLVMIVANPATHEVKEIMLFIKRMGKTGVLTGYMYKQHNVKYLFLLRRGVYRQIKPKVI